MRPGQLITQRTPQHDGKKDAKNAVHHLEDPAAEVARRRNEGPRDLIVLVERKPGTPPLSAIIALVLFLWMWPRFRS